MKHKYVELDLTTNTVRLLAENKYPIAQSTFQTKEKAIEVANAMSNKMVKQ